MIVSLPILSALLAVILPLGLHVNFSASAPRGLYRTVRGRPTRGGRGLSPVWVLKLRRTRTGATTSCSTSTPTVTTGPVSGRATRRDGLVARLMHLFATSTAEQFLELGKAAGITEVEPAATFPRAILWRCGRQRG